jgi:5'-nucleotidase
MIPIAVALMLSACSAGAAKGTSSAAGAPAQTMTLSIVGTNDLHGGILQREDRGGLALLGGYVANLRAARARDGGAVLLVDGGDMFQGTLESNLTEGQIVIAAYNTLGYSAAAIGNHEFDFGPAGPASQPKGLDDDPRGALKARAAQASFPFLAANLIDTATGRPVAFPHIQPSVIVTVAGLKVEPDRHGDGTARRVSPHPAIGHRHSRWPQGRDPRRHDDEGVDRDHRGECARPAHRAPA